MKRLTYIIYTLFFVIGSSTYATAQNPSIYSTTVTSTSITACGVVTYTINFHFTGDGHPHAIKVSDIWDNTHFNTITLADIAAPTGFTTTLTGNIINCSGVINSSTGVSGQIIIHASARSGAFKNCATVNTAKIYLDNSATPADTKLFPNVLITAQNKWTILKELVGMVSTNTFRYKITISSPACNAYNLYSAAITDNPGMGGLVINYNGSPTPPSNSYTVTLFTLTVGNTYTRYIDVKYPCALANGQVVTNCVTLKGNSPGDCSASGTGWSQQTLAPACADATISQFSFTLGNNAPVKTHNANRNHSPGCEDEYTISYKNNSTGVINNLTVCDLFPFNYLELLSCTSAFSVYINGVLQTSPLPRFGATCSNSNPLITSGNCTGIVPANLSWNFSNLNPNDYITIKIKFRIRPLAPFVQVTNTVTLNGTANAAYTTDLCNPLITYPVQTISATTSDQFNIETAAPRPIISKTVTNGSVFRPGDIVKFKVCISNYGGAPFSGVFSDLIDHDVFTNASIADFHLSAHQDSDEPTQCSYDALSTNISSSFSYNSTSHSLVSTSINVPGQCMLNRFSNLIIEFQATLKPDAWLCHYQNTAKFTMAAATPIPPPNPIIGVADFYVQDASLLGMEKLVDADGDGTFSSGEQAFPGQTVRYRVRLRNLSTVNLKNIQIFDNLPTANDHSIQSTPTPLRNSANCATLETVTSPSSVTGGTTVILPLVTNTHRYDDVVPVPGLSAAPGFSYYAATASGVVMHPGDDILIEYSAKVPLTAQPGTTANNDVLIMADLAYDLANPPSTCVGPTNTGYSLAPTNTPSATINIVKGIPCCVGITSEISVANESITYQAGASPGSAGETLWNPTFSFSYNGLPVKKITISVVNSWITYNNTDCAREFTYPLFLGTLFNVSPPASLHFGNLLLDPLSNNYSPQFWSVLGTREVIYDNIAPGATTNFTTAQPVTLGIFLPDVKSIPCCAGKATVILKFSVEDVNCNICDFFYTRDNIDILPHQ